MAGSVETQVMAQAATATDRLARSRSRVMLRYLANTTVLVSARRRHFLARRPNRRVRTVTHDERDARSR